MLTLFTVAIVIRAAFQEAESPTTSVQVQMKASLAPAQQEVISVQLASAPLSLEEKEKSKRIAMAFIQAYATSDGKDPETYLRNSQSYMTEALYEKEGTHLRRDTLDRNQTKVLKTEVYPVEPAPTGQVAWNVVALLEGTSPSGHTVKEEVWYWLTMKKEETTWKVAEVGMEWCCLSCCLSLSVVRKRRRAYQWSGSRA